jgi:hypothetical protein
VAAQIVRYNRATFAIGKHLAKDPPFGICDRLDDWHRWNCSDGVVELARMFGVDVRHAERSGARGRAQL